MNKKVYIIGAGGHGRVVKDIIESQNDRVVGFIDDNSLLHGTLIDGVEVLGGLNILPNMHNAHCIIAIGDNYTREKIRNVVGDKVVWYTAIDKSAVISKTAIVGEGTVIMPNAVINSSSSIGNHVIINSGSIIEHDCIIHDYAHIAPRVAIGGMVEVGRRTQMGIGSCAKNGIEICDDCLIGAGSVVVKNIDESGIYVGVPSARMR